MKNLLFFAGIFLLSSCVSVKKYNEKLETPVAAEKLKADVDYTQHQLEKLHPKLYWYISKESLDFKFDSLKTTIKKPLKPQQFYEKLAPVIADIREGHLRLYSVEKKLTKKEIRDLKKQKGLLSRFNFWVEDNRVFVKDNPDSIANMNVGTEIISIHDIPLKNLIEKYKPFVNSDGFNTTFQTYSMASRWPTFFTEEFGILDSVKVSALYKNEHKTFYLHREKISKSELKKKEKQEKKITKSEKGKTRDYNIISKSFNRDLQFPLQDSTVAYMKIKTFSGTYSRKFYRESFATLKKSPAEFLILDIRDNLGGSLAEINNLYSYLVSENFQFINNIEVTSRASMLQADYFREFPPLLKPLAVLVYPFYFVGSALSVKKEGDRFLLRNNGFFSIKKPKKDHFKGKIYVLINGSSFSASSIIASKLKDAKCAILVGEETGGANDGTVAGRYSTKKLPNSRLKLPIGLMLIQPDITYTFTKKGVVPNKKILPSLEQIFQKKDVQLQWIFDDIENMKNEKAPD